MTASKNTNLAYMKIILDREINTSTQMLESLANERISILEGDAVSLESAVQDKEQALVQLTHLEQQRMSMMEKAGYKPGPDGMVLYLNQEQNKGEISDLWKKLLNLAAKCRDQNRENHQLVEMYSHHAHQALCILRGEDTDQEVYDPGGNTRDHHERRSLAKA